MLAFQQELSDVAHAKGARLRAAYEGN
jgi:hypothetical protein